MPIYEYKCPSCGHEEEKLVKASEGDQQKCSSCKENTKKTMSSCCFKMKQGCGGVHNTKMVG